jgi:plastocyanin
MHPKRTFFAVFTILLCLPLASAAPGTAEVSGRVTFDGQPARPKIINMSSDPNCAKLYSHSPTSEDVVVGSGGTLSNVVVYLSSGDAPPENTAVPGMPKTLDQKGCRYAPHVLAVQTNQELQVINDDHTVHNIHPLPKENREWNKAQPPGAPPLTEAFGRPEFIPVKCNIHPWMHGYIAVLKTPRYSVTSSDGAFALENLPPGKYTVTAWHEAYGTQTQEIVINGNEKKTLDFVFKPH